MSRWMMAERTAACDRAALLASHHRRMHMYHHVSVYQSAAYVCRRLTSCTNILSRA
jgi:hypothetical protein